MRIGNWIVVAAGALAMGCTQVALVPGAGLPQTPSVTAPPVAGFRCPAKGTTLTTTGNTSIFHGTAPNDPEACLVQFWNVPEPRPQLFTLIYAGSTEAEKFRQAMRQISPFTSRAAAEYVATRGESQAQWKFTVTAMGQETITVPAGSFRVNVIAIDEEGFAGNYFKARSLWYLDILSWLPLRYVRTIERGTGASGMWEARSIGRAPV